jgi:RNA polymerase sigma-70 factor, ECF subfamily
MISLPREPEAMDHADNSTMPSEESSGSTVDWALLVGKIRDGDPAGMEQLYALFARGMRFFLYRRLGPQELDDKIHDVFLIVVQAIRRGDLREPERLMGFVRTIVRRQVAAHIDQVVHSRKEEMSLEPGVALPDHTDSPEENAMGQERTQLMLKVLRGLSTRDREILTRFYLQGQSQEQICVEMNLTDTQFRLLKSRAKARFGEMGRRRLESKPKNVFARTFDSFRH